MSRFRFRCWSRAIGVLIGTATFVVSGALTAEPKKDSKAVCVTAYKEGQVHRKNGELLLARDDFSVCAGETCPAVLRHDCTPWLAKVQESIPSIVVKASSSTGKPLSDLHVFLDGKAPEKTGFDSDIEVDPGAHVVRVEVAGHLAIEKSVKVRSGDKKTSVEFRLLPLPGQQSGVSRPIPASAIAFTVVGLASMGVFAGFGIHGNELKKGLDACKPACAPARVDQVKRDYIVADASIGVGVVFLGLATWSFVTRPDVPRQTTTWNLHVAPGQTIVTFGGSF